MRISDWSSDVCSSDLRAVAHDARHGLANSPLENRAPRHKTELMCPLDHGVTLVADHDGAAVDTLDRFAALRHDIPQSRFLQIGRASCGERVCNDVYISVVCVSFNKQKKTISNKK